MQTFTPAIRARERSGGRGESGGADEVTERRSERIIRMFSLYVRYYLRKHFHAIYVDAPPDLAAAAGSPCIVYLNHPSWWDPLVCLALERKFFPQRLSYGAMEAEALSNYGFFRRLGFFGVEPGTRRGAVDFLRTSEQLLGFPENVLWLTPQGRFADPRERPLRLRSGLAHLAGRLERVTIFPLAIEYFLGSERLPQVGVRFGEPVRVDEHSGWSIGEWQEHLEGRLMDVLERLGGNIVSRRILAAPPLFSGRKGTGGVYGAWERFRGAVGAKQPQGE